MSQDQAELPIFPFARTVGDLASPPGGRPGVPVSRVRLPTGRTAWLATRHADVRQMLRSGAFSSDMTKPGFPLMVNADASAPMPGFFLAIDPPGTPGSGGCSPRNSRSGTCGGSNRSSWRP